MDGVVRGHWLAQLVTLFVLLLFGSNAFAQIEVDLQILPTGIHPHLGAGLGEETHYTVTVNNTGPTAVVAPLYFRKPSATSISGVTSGFHCQSVQLPEGQRDRCTRSQNAPWAPGTTTFTLRLRLESIAWWNSVSTESLTCTVDLPGDASSCDAPYRYWFGRKARKFGPEAIVPGSEFTWEIRFGWWMARRPPVMSFRIGDTLPDGFELLNATLHRYHINGGGVWTSEPCDITGDHAECSGWWNSDNPVPGIIHPSFPHNPGVADTYGYGMVVLDVKAPDDLRGYKTNHCDFEITGIGTVSGPTECLHGLRVRQVADLEAVKTVSSPNVVQNEPFSYEITVTNHGPDSTGNVVSLTDTLPHSVSPVGPLPGGCTRSGQTIACDLISMAAGQSRSVTLNVSTTAPPGSVLHNHCYAQTKFLNNGGSAHDPDTSNNSCHAETTVVEAVAPSLEISKMGPQSVMLGQTFNYVLTVANVGTGPMVAMTLTDPLPSQVEFVSVNAQAPVSCDHNAGTVTCGLNGILPANESRQVTIRVRATGAGSVRNVCSGVFDGPIQVDDCDTTTVVEPGTVVVNKSSSANPVYLGQIFTYNLAVTNTSGGTAPDVQVIDVLPAGLDFVSVGSPAPFSCAHANGTVTCTASGVEHGTAITIPIQVRATQLGTVTNTCQVSVHGEQVAMPGCTDDTDVENGHVTVIKSASGETINLGDDFHYTLQVSNTSQGPARDVVITDPLPATVQFQSVNAQSPFSCAHNSGTVTCTADEVAVGMERSITLHVRAISAGSAENSCQVSIGGEPSVQECIVPVDVPPARISVTKTDSVDPVQLGENFAYTLRIENLTGSVAEDVVITDPLPEGLEFISVVNPSGYGCSHDGQAPGVVTCTASSHAPESTVFATINVRAVSAGTVTNTCQWSIDGVSSTNRGCFETTTINPGRIAVSKEGPAEVEVGDEFDYQLLVEVTEAGVTDVTVIDPLPRHVEPLNVTADPAFSCAISGQDVTCDAEFLAVDTTSLINIRVLAVTPGTTVNTCVGVAGAGAVDSTDCQVTTTIPQAAVEVVKEAVPGSVMLGDNYDWVITVTNTDPDGRSLIGAYLRDEIPGGHTVLVDMEPGATFQPVDLDTSNATCSLRPTPSPLLACTIDDLAPGESAVIRVGMNATYGGLFVNECVLWSDDTVIGTCQAPVRVLNGEMSVVKSATPSATFVGDTVLYRLAWSNDLTMSVSDVTIVDVLPAGFVAGEVSEDSPFNCLITNGGSEVECVAATVPAGASGMIQIKTVASAVPGTWTNICSASATGAPLFDDSLCVADVTLGAGYPDLVKASSHDPVPLGTIFEYQITATNPHDYAIPAFDVRDDLPLGVSFVGVTHGPGFSSCGLASAGVVECSSPGLAAGGSASFRIMVRAVAVGLHENICVGSVAGQPFTSECWNETQVIAPDLNVVKFDSQDPVETGEAFDYLLAWDYTGVDPAFGLVIVDNLPSGMVAQAVSSDTALMACSLSTPTRLECSADRLDEGDSGIITLSVIAPSVPGEYLNTCVIEADGRGRGQRGEGCREDTTVLPALRVSKTDLADPVFVGESITYHVTVQNLDDQAAPITVLDPIPAGTSYVSAVDTSGHLACSLAADTVSCAGTVPAESSSVIELVVTAPGQPGSVLNVCEVVYDGLDEPYPMPQTCEELTDVIERQSGLVATKVSSTNPVGVGEQFSYTLTVVNNGPHDATNAVVTDPLPSEVAFVHVDASPEWSCAFDHQGHELTCTRDLVPVGPAGWITAHVTAPDTPMDIVNTCTVDSDGVNPTDPPPCEVTTTVEEADIEVVKTVLTPNPVVNSLISYELQVRNTSLVAVAEDVHVRDILPAGTVYEHASGQDWYCVHDGSASGGVVDCHASSVQPGASVAIGVFVYAPPEPGPIRNICVWATGALGELAGEGCEVETVVQGEPRLIATKTPDEPVVGVGDTVIWTITVTNEGTAVAESVQIGDTMHDSLDFIRATPSVGSCVEINSHVSCSLGDLDAGSTATVVIETIVIEPGEVPNICVASHESRSSRPRRGDPMCMATVEVLPAEVSVMKTAGSTDVLVGEPIHYQLMVSNTDVAVAYDVTVSDALPSGTVFQSAAGPGWVCVHDADTPNPAGQVNCSKGTVGKGAAEVIDLVVTAPMDPGPIVNTCVWSDRDSPGVSGPGQCEVSVDVGGEPRLIISKAPGEPAADVGDTVTWTITVNNQGTAAAEDVVILDVIDPSLELVSAVASQGSCVSLDDQVSCQLGQVDAGAVATVTIQTVVLEPGRIDNSCDISTSSDVEIEGLCLGSIDVEGRPLLIREKAASDPRVKVQDTVTWTITVRNIGNATATDVVVFDSLASTLRFDGAVSSQGSCVYDGAGIVTCELGDLPAGEAATVRVTTTVLKAGYVQNGCEVDASNASVSTDRPCSTGVNVDDPEGPAPAMPVPVDDWRALLVLILMMLSVGWIGMATRR